MIPEPMRKKLFYVIRILYILMSVPRLIDEGKKNLKKKKLGNLGREFKLDTRVGEVIGMMFFFSTTFERLKSFSNSDFDC